MLVCRSLRRLARGSYLAGSQRQRTADLHDHHPHGTSLIHVDARSAISIERCLAKRRLQPTDSAGLLSRAWDEAAAAAKNRSDSARRAIKKVAVFAPGLSCCSRIRVPALSFESVEAGKRCCSDEL